MNGDDDILLWGELREGLHVAGYTFERACSRLEHLVVSDAWKFGGRFETVNDFLNSLRLDNLRPAAEQRQRIALRIKELQPTASNRQIARTLGVSHQTVGRDTGPSGPQASPNDRRDDTRSGDGGPSRPPPANFSGARAAKLVGRRETASADRLARVAADEARVLKLAPVVGKFRTLVIDPAWEYDWLSLAGRAKPGYAMQTLDQLRTLDLRQWADPAGCHLYCWVTNNFFYEGGKIVEHWGFQHRVVLTWVKPPPFGLGSYFRNSTEHVLFATLGETTTRHAAASIPTLFEAPRGEHSEKPERFYDIVRAASYPPYGEANQRKSRPDFANLFVERSEPDDPMELPACLRRSPS
jgi:N6-adenosine-specific RNA methylase IME4